DCSMIAIQAAQAARGTQATQGASGYSPPRSQPLVHVATLYPETSPDTPSRGRVSRALCPYLVCIACRGPTQLTGEALSCASAPYRAGRRGKMSCAWPHGGGAGGFPGSPLPSPPPPGTASAAPLNAVSSAMNGRTRRRGAARLDEGGSQGVR